MTESASRLLTASTRRAALSLCIVNLSSEETGACAVSCRSLHNVINRLEKRVMKILLWIVGIIFLIGLLVVTGVLKMIF